MALEASDLVAGVACHSGYLMMDLDENEGPPYSPVAIAEVHGMDDTAVPYPPSVTPQYDYAGARPNMRMWADLAGCEPATDTNYSDVDSGEPYTFTEYSAGCAASTGYLLVSLPGVGHEPYPPSLYPGPVETHVPTTQLVWNFVKQFRLVDRPPRSPPSSPPTSPPTYHHPV